MSCIHELGSSGSESNIWWNRTRGKEENEIIASGNIANCIVGRERSGTLQENLKANQSQLGFFGSNNKAANWDLSYTMSSMKLHNAGHVVSKMRDSQKKSRVFPTEHKLPPTQLEECSLMIESTGIIRVQGRPQRSQLWCGSKQTRITKA